MVRAALALLRDEFGLAVSVPAGEHGELYKEYIGRTPVLEGEEGTAVVGAA